MSLARIGGYATLLGCALEAAGWAIGYLEPSPGPIETFLLVAGVVLIGVGAGVLIVAAVPPLTSALAAIGLGLAAVGLLGVTLGQHVVVIPAGTNTLQSWPYLIGVFGGGLATAAGSLMCSMALGRTARDSQLVGLVFLVAFATVASSSMLFPVLGFAGIGLLALRGAGGVRGTGPTG